MLISPIWCRVALLRRKYVWEEYIVFILRATSLITLKMWAICSSETSIRLSRATQRNIPEDNILQDLGLRSGNKDGMRILGKTLEFSTLTNVISGCGNWCLELVERMNENSIPTGISALVYEQNRTFEMGSCNKDLLRMEHSIELSSRNWRRSCEVSLRP
jgi:hypothetical protein